MITLTFDALACADIPLLVRPLHSFRQHLPPIRCSPFSSISRSDFTLAPDVLSHEDEQVLLRGMLIPVGAMHSGDGLSTLSGEFRLQSDATIARLV
jgi:hypothetical protein